MKRIALSSALKLLTAGLVLACAPQVRAQSMTGYWAGTLHFPEVDQCWVADVRQSGELVISYVARYPGHAPFHFVETGRWTFKNGVYTAQIDNTSGDTTQLGEERDREHAYRVDLLTDEQVALFHLRYRLHLNQRRVPAEFTFKEDCLDAR